MEKSETRAVDIVRKLTSAGYVAFFAGGCVRDKVMRKKAQDYDIATSAKPEDIERLFEKTVPVGKQFGVMIVMIERQPFEVATFRKDQAYQDGRHPTGVSFTSAEMDAKRRDFTVNGLFYDPFTRKLIDYVGGREDIRRKVIRTIGSAEQRFREDGLRILRAVRFAANLGFTIEEKTWKAIRRNSSMIRKVSHERVRDELVKMLTRKGAGRGLELLSDSGLLKEILPEIDAMKGVKQPPEYHPEGDVFTHTRILMDRFKEPSVELAFGALLHDVGKPLTYSCDKGEIHFYNHPHIGAEIAKRLLARLRFSNQEIGAIASCVENHMKFANAREMRVGKLKQFIARPTFEMELKMHREDCLASHKNLDIYRFLNRKVREFKKEELKPRPLINGYDVMDLGVKAGPQMKEILGEVYTLQLEGKLKSKAEALGWVKMHYVKVSK